MQTFIRYIHNFLQIYSQIDLFANLILSIPLDSDLEMYHLITLSESVKEIKLTKDRFLLHIFQKCFLIDLGHIVHVPVIASLKSLNSLKQLHSKLTQILQTLVQIMKCLQLFSKTKRKIYSRQGSLILSEDSLSFPSGFRWLVLLGLFVTSVLQIDLHFFTSHLSAYLGQWLSHPSLLIS